MLKSLRVLQSQGRQYIPDVRAAVPLGFRGKPRIAAGACASGCGDCERVCPTDAIRLDPVRIDLGRCVFCNECAEECPEKKIEFTSEVRMGATHPDGLLVHAGEPASFAIEASAALQKAFGRSLKLRQVSAGGCNACE